MLLPTRTTAEETRDVKPQQEKKKKKKKERRKKKTKKKKQKKKMTMVAALRPLPPLLRWAEEQNERLAIAPQTGLRRWEAVYC